MLNKENQKRIYNSKRGQYEVMDPYEISGVEPPKLSKRAEAIAISEYEILVHKARDINNLYENDGHLIDAYKRSDYKAFINRCITNNTSKNNCLHIIGGCLSLIHFTPECLTVVSRSMDYDKAHVTDAYIAYLFMKATGAKSWKLISLNPHRYLDKTQIARRDGHNVDSSNCKKEEVTCVLVDSSFLKRVKGYNYIIDTNKCNDCDSKTCGVVHAEQDALNKWDAPEKPHMAFVTKQPCEKCHKSLKAAGVKHIHVVDKTDNIFK